jgi:hypothetical protein
LVPDAWRCEMLKYSRWRQMHGKSGVIYGSYKAVRKAPLSRFVFLDRWAWSATTFRSGQRLAPQQLVRHWTPIERRQAKNGYALHRQLETDDLLTPAVFSYSMHSVIYTRYELEFGFYRDGGWPNFGSLQSSSDPIRPSSTTHSMPSIETEKDFSSMSWPAALLWSEILLANPFSKSQRCR